MLCFQSDGLCLVPLCVPGPCHPNLVRGVISHQTQALLDRLKPSAHHHTNACHHTAGAHTIRPSKGAKALEGGHHGHIDDHTVRGLAPGTGPGGDHDRHAAEAILGDAPAKLCLQPWTYYGSYCATEKRLSFVPPLPEAMLGSASNLCQLLNEMPELIRLYVSQM